jgi:hypothetical protein
MKPTKKIVTIVWLDAHTLGQEAVKIDEAIERAHHPLETETTGALVHSDEIGVSLATDIQIEDSGEILYAGIHFVPRGMIVSEKVSNAPRRTRAPKVVSQPPRAPSKASRMRAAILEHQLQGAGAIVDPLEIS